MQKIEIGLMLKELSDVNVKNVTIHYSGAGDSGSIDEIVTNIRVEEKTGKNKFSNWDSVKGKLEDWAYDRLTSMSDWCNNDGGQGRITIKVPSGEYEIHHEVNVINVESEEEEGNIIQESQDD